MFHMDEPIMVFAFILQVINAIVIFSISLYIKNKKKNEIVEDIKTFKPLTIVYIVTFCLFGVIGVFIGINSII